MIPRSYGLSRYKNASKVHRDIMNIVKVNNVLTSNLNFFRLISMFTLLYLGERSSKVIIRTMVAIAIQILKSKKDIGKSILLCHTHKSKKYFS